MQIGRPRRNYCDGPVVSCASYSPISRYVLYFFVFLFFLYGSGTGYKYSVKVDVVSTWGRRTNPYIGFLLDDCNLASKEPMYRLFRLSGEHM